MPHIIGSSNWPCVVDSTRSSDEVNSTNLDQHSASSEWPFLSHYFHWAYYFQFPTLFWTKFKRDELPGFARYRSLLLKTLKSSAHKLTLKLRDINFISEPLHICICIPSYLQTGSSTVKKLISDSWGTKLYPCRWVYTNLNSL